MSSQVTGSGTREVVVLHERSPQHVTVVGTTFVISGPGLDGLIAIEISREAIRVQSETFRVPEGATGLVSVSHADNAVAHSQIREDVATLLIPPGQVAALVRQLNAHLAKFAAEITSE